jgi:hypothetical protein
VTRLVPRISNTPWPGIKTKTSYKFLSPMNSGNYKSVHVCLNVHVSDILLSPPPVLKQLFFTEFTVSC